MGGRYPHQELVERRDKIYGKGITRGTKTWILIWGLRHIENCSSGPTKVMLGRGGVYRNPTVPVRKKQK